MLNIDEYKIAQLALDYYMEHGDLRQVKSTPQNAPMKS